MLRSNQGMWWWCLDSGLALSQVFEVNYKQWGAEISFDG